MPDGDLPPLIVWRQFIELPYLPRAVELLKYTLVNLYAEAAMASIKAVHDIATPIITPRPRISIHVPVAAIVTPIPAAYRKVPRMVIIRQPNLSA